MLTITSGKATGCNLWIPGLVGDVVLTGVGEAYFERLGGVAPGDEVLIDNSPYLAFQTYHRHQVHPDYPVWDHFLVDRVPVYPQRPNVIGTSMSRPGTGTVQSGRFGAKMIVVESLMDEAAYPWQAAWYDDLVHEVQGDGAAERFRLYFVDHAMHMAPMDMPDDPPPVGRTRYISYAGVLQQALRDLANWAEQDIPPPSSTRYEVVQGQVHVPAVASDRGGVQATVEVAANGSDRADVSVGEGVTFSAFIEVPPGAGTLVGAEWDFEGYGTFPVQVEGLDGSSSRYRAEATYAFDQPGTYFPALRVASHRQGDLKSHYARVLNLGRVRVVVSADSASI
jgi:hypothetical protein